MQRSAGVALRVTVPGPEGSADREIALTAFFPSPLPAQAPVIVALPGAGYSRGYFDLPEPGFSQAEHHLAAGSVVLALDHLGVGESSVPTPDITTMATVTAANHAAVRLLVERLQSGTLAPGHAPVVPTAVVGVGQSMGGCIAVAMQAHHRTFDALALLGSSMVSTSMPLRPGATPVVVPEGTDPVAAAMMMMAAIDWRYAFHVEDGSPTLVDADVAAGLPMRTAAAPWASPSVPGLVAALAVPGALSRDAAAIDVPVLVAGGERDVTVRLVDELAAFSGTGDLAGFVLPRSAHMHNFSGTRALLWERIDAFVRQVARAR